MKKRPRYQILLVDDDPMITTTVARILEGFDCGVESASNGDEAVQRLERRQFHAVCTDLEMPGMGGIELIRHVRSRFSPTAVILMTGRAHDDHVLGAGADAYLKKPFAPEELLDALERAVQARKAARESAFQTDPDGAT